MHQKRNFRHGNKGTTVLGEKKGPEAGARAMKEDDPRILMCTECTIHGNKCRGTCEYRGK